MLSDEDEIVRDAAGIVRRAELAILEGRALETLRGLPGLALVPLCPPSTAIQVVALDGEHLGRVRRTSGHLLPEEWVAVPPGPAKPSGSYPSARAAARALLLRHEHPERR